MYFDPKIENQAHHICHCIGQNEGIELSDKSRSDIFLTVRAIADLIDSEKLREENHLKRWNEVKIWLKNYPLTASTDDIRVIMGMLERGEYIRDYQPKHIQELYKEMLR